LNRWPNIRIAGDFVVKPGTELGPRTLADYELVYFPRPESAIYTLEGTAVTLSEPGFILTRPGQLHHYRFRKDIPVRHQFVHFTWPDPGGRFELLPASIPCPAHGLPPRLMQEMMAVMHAQREDWREHCAALLFVLLHALMRCGPEDLPSGEPVGIRHAKRFIAERLGQPLSVRQIARHVGWSHEHFSRMFRRTTGISPQAFILQQRVEYAARLLLSTTDTIKEVAFQAGFGDAHYFSRCFRKLKGIPPHRFRSRNSDSRMDYVHPAAGEPSPYPLNTYFHS